MFRTRPSQPPEQPPEMDETLKDLTFQRDDIIRELAASTKKVEVKKTSIATGRPAHYYGNAFVEGFTKLTHTLKFYEDEKAYYEKRKLDVDERIAQHMESKKQPGMKGPGRT